jgi:hypothetical protein
MKDMCESCLMPFKNDTGKRENKKYCSLCFKGGKLCYPGDDLKTFQKYCYEGMRKRGMNPILAGLFTWIVSFAPRWKKN